MTWQSASARWRATARSLLRSSSRVTRNCAPEATASETKTSSRGSRHIGITSGSGTWSDRCVTTRRSRAISAGVMPYRRKNRCLVSTREISLSVSAQVTGVKARLSTSSTIGPQNPRGLSAADIQTFVSTTARTAPLAPQLVSRGVDVALDFVGRYSGRKVRLNAGAKCSPGFGVSLVRIRGRQELLHCQFGGLFQCQTRSLGSVFQSAVGIRAQIHDRHVPSIAGVIRPSLTCLDGRAVPSLSVTRGEGALWRGAVVVGRATRLLRAPRRCLGGAP